MAYSPNSTPPPDDSIIRRSGEGANHVLWRRFERDTPHEELCLVAFFVAACSHVRVYAWWMGGLTDVERRALRSAPVAELGRAEEQAASLARQFDDIVAAAEMSNTDDEHDPEGTTIAFERAQVIALQSQAVRDAAALRRRLADVDEDEFGACEHCGRPIGFERLVALPSTRRCVECAR